MQPPNLLFSNANGDHIVRRIYIYIYIYIHRDVFTVYRLQDGVRQAVALSEELDTVWKSRGGTFWRYVAFINGVIRMFPGPIFATNYDHTVRGW